MSKRKEKPFPVTIRLMSDQAEALLKAARRVSDTGETVRLAELAENTVSAAIDVARFKAKAAAKTMALIRRRPRTKGEP